MILFVLPDMKSTSPKPIIPLSECTGRAQGEHRRWSLCAFGFTTTNQTTATPCVFQSEPVFFTSSCTSHCTCISADSNVPDICPFGVLPVVVAFCTDEGTLERSPGLTDATYRFYALHRYLIMQTEPEARVDRCHGVQKVLSSGNQASRFCLVPQTCRSQGGNPFSLFPDILAAC